MDLKYFQAVGNAVEVKGSGVLFLGTGKSSNSVFLTLLYKDTFLVADDYVELIYIPYLLRYFPKKHTFEEEEYKTYHREVTSELIATATSRITTAKLRNDLISFTPYYEVSSSKMKQKFLASNFGIYNSPLDNLRKSSKYIDTITQRVSHKEWTKIECVIFLIDFVWELSFLEGLIVQYFDKRYSKVRGLDDKNRAIKEQKRISQYLFRKFFNIRGKTATPKKNTYIIEEDFKLRGILMDILRLFDNRGDDWRRFFDKNSKLQFMVFFYYDNPIDKVRAIYDAIEKVVPERIIDQNELSIRWQEEEDLT